MKYYAVLAIFVLLAGALPLPTMAQTQTECAQSELGDPPRIVYRCAGGIVLEAEAAAVLGIVNSGGDNRPNDVELTSDAILIDVAPASGPFQIRTPHAIAAVRGTEYIVDVTAEKTAVFVRRGEVVVSRLDGSDHVTLTVGLGADVAAGQPIVARQWPAERVNKLLDRFGR